MKARHLIIVCLVVLIAAQFLYYYPQLPENMATHFGGSGDANGWMSRPMFAVFEVVLFTFVFVEMLLVPRAIAKMPNSTINLPNKEYWLAPERRAGTMDIFRGYFQGFGIGMLALLFFVNQLVYGANIASSGDPRLGSSIWLAIVGFVAFTFVWLIRLILEFRKPS